MDIGDQVLDALLLHRLDEFAALRDPPRTFCIDGYEEQRIAKLIERAARSRSDIVAAASCPPTSFVVIWIGAPVRMNDREFQVRSRYHTGPTNGEEGLFTLTSSGDRWKVTKYVTSWVSRSDSHFKRANAESR